MSTSLATRLGYDDTTRVVILSADGLGAAHATNVGVYDAIRTGLATTAALMPPCPWARESAARYRGEDIGVALTLTAEFELYKWGPLTQAPSLLGGDGGYPGTIADVWDHAELDEVRRECRAQLERAVLWGFDITFLASHLDVLSLRPEFFDVYIDLAVHFGLPVRGVPEHLRQQLGFPLQDLLAEEGVLSPDRTIRASVADHAADIEQLIIDLEPGVTEILLQPARDYPEIRSLTDDWPARVSHLDQVTTGSELRAAIERSDVQLTGYRALRELQRSA